MKQPTGSNPTSNLSNFEAQFKRSTIPLLYTVLNKLKGQGFIEESRHEISEKNQVRVYYAITEEGRAYLSQLKALYRTLSDIVSKLLK